MGTISFRLDDGEGAVSSERDDLVTTSGTQRRAMPHFSHVRDALDRVDGFSWLPRTDAGEAWTKTHLS